MSYGVRALFEEQRSLAAGFIDGSYTIVGSLFTHKARMVIIQNLTDALLQFSIDGITDHFPIASQTSFILDLSSNRVQDQIFAFSEANGIYVTEIGDPTTGSVYVSVIYALGD